MRVVCINAADIEVGIEAGRDYRVRALRSPTHVELEEFPDVWFTRDRFRRVDDNPNVIYVGRGAWANADIWKGERL